MSELLPRPQHTVSSRPSRPAVTSLGHRLPYRGGIPADSEIVIGPRDGGVGRATIHQHPRGRVIGLDAAGAHSSGVINRQRTD